MRDMDMFEDSAKCNNCGGKLDIDNACTNTNCDYAGYSFDETLGAELNNNLYLANKAVGDLNIETKPQFHILGGVALYYHSLNYSFTLDIDTANKIDAEVKRVINTMLDDNASEVAILGRHYAKRLVRIKEHLAHIEVFIISMEDLLISKLATGRRKDYQALKTTGILNKANIELVREILSKEIEPKISELCEKNLNNILKEIYQ